VREIFSWKNREKIGEKKKKKKKKKKMMMMM
jgi:hypothetical protein